MTVTLLDRPPRTLTRSLGPYRRCDYMALPDEPRCESAAAPEITVDTDELWAAVDRKFSDR